MYFTEFLLTSVIEAAGMFSNKALVSSWNEIKQKEKPSEAEICHKEFQQKHVIVCQTYKQLQIGFSERNIWWVFLCSIFSQWEYIFQIEINILILFT